MFRHADVPGQAGRCPPMHAAWRTRAGRCGAAHGRLLLQAQRQNPLLQAAKGSVAGLQVSNQQGGAGRRRAPAGCSRRDASVERWRRCGGGLEHWGLASCDCGDLIALCIHHGV